MKARRVEAGAHLERVAKELEKFDQITPPAWAAFVKTGAHKQRPPSQDNWWHLRAAAILRKVALKGPIGTQKLRVLFGGRKNRGHKPNRFEKAGGNIIRTILQQLQAAELIKEGLVEGHKGRVVTAKGHSLLDKTANEVNA